MATSWQVDKFTILLNDLEGVSLRQTRSWWTSSPTPPVFLIWIDFVSSFILLGELPISIIKMRANGVSISLAGNIGFTLPSDMGELANIRRLDLSNCSLTGIYSYTSTRRIVSGEPVLDPPPFSVLTWLRIVFYSCRRASFFNHQDQDNKRRKR